MHIKDYLPAPMPVEDLRTLLGYDPDTGRFWWKINKQGRGSGRIRAGFPAGGPPNKKSGYVFIGISMRVYMAHRLAWYLMTGEWPPAQIDHRNLVKSDNRFDNLRLATRAQNIYNRKTGGTPSGYRCVYRVNQKWKAQVCVNYHQINLGVFNTPEAAYNAVCTAIQIARGEFARID